MTDPRPPAAPVLINSRPRPRLLVQGFDDEVVERIREFVPSVRVIDQYPSEVRQSEWDAIVTRSSMTHTARHMFGLVVVPEFESQWIVESLGDGKSLRVDRDEVSEELLRYPGLPDRLARLTHEVLEPLAKRRDQHTTVSVKVPSGHPVILGRGVQVYRAPSEPHDLQLRPFLATGDGHALACSYTRRDGAQVWVLPGDIPDIIPWLKAALTEWHEIAPDRFPGLPDWAGQPRWQTQAERQLVAGLSLLDAERRQIEAHLQRRRQSLQRQLEAATASADSYERALLTEDSDQLVEAVIRALRELGFGVVDADVDASPGDNLEDLQITDADEPGWLVLAEVKGYTKGASTTAIQQLARFTTRYVLRTGQAPSGEWYIANQFRNHEPPTRQRILNGKDEDVRAFGENGGLVLDTQVLFQTLDLVRAGAVTADEARSHLRSSLGIAAAPSTA